MRGLDHRPRRRPVQREKAVQGHIVQLIRSLGGRAYVMGTRRRSGDFQGTMQTPGIPDVMAFLPSPPRADVDGRTLLFIECKAARGRLRPEQREFQALCHGSNVAHIVGGLDDVIAWLAARGYVRAS